MMAGRAWKTVLPVCAIASVVLFIHVEFWSWGVGDYYGAPDMHIWRGVALMVRHGTLRYAYDHRQLAARDPEAFRELAATTMGLRPWAGGWMYMPPAALLTLPATWFGWDATRYGFALLQLGLWIWLFASAWPTGWRWVAVGLAPWMPDLHNALANGGSVVVLLALLAHGGTLGLVMAGWCKPWVWACGIFRRRFWAWLLLTAIGGALLVGVRPGAWVGGFALARECGDLIGRHMPAVVTYAGMAACCLLGVAGADPVAVFAIGLGVSPMWWQSYWLAVTLAVVRWLGRRAKEERWTNALWC